MKAITIKDIAKKCGVGVSTVSRAINNHPDINEETRRMIMEVIKESNFIPNNSARNLKLSDTKTIGVLIKGIDNPFFQNMIKVFEEEIQNRKYTFILHRVDSSQDEVEVALELIKEKRLKGIVFLGGSFSHQEDKLQEIKIPFVLSTIAITDNVDKNLYSSVSVDDVYESKKIVDFLCDNGHKKIAILASYSTDMSISNLRLEGYRKSLRSRNITINENLIRYTWDSPNSYSMENGYNLTKELINSKEEFTAIYAISDSMAIGACKAILECGKRIPEDYSVVGFDGLDITYYYNPSITTIRQPIEEMAKETTKILFDLINKKSKNQHKIFEGKLLVRQSTSKLDK
ncbi:MULTISPECIES: LacI family DNA-binding transcriptional regulator [unclassified Romboutsia]|uniref:LacI family DNA-binding transcriptional regulator n=1 Tax=unclassified Romboutsia TaxID=2626894 RepID=UPI00189B5F08|nr:MULTISPECIES: LacI family DNA-binding transcriptional regulator [unclassified Romboutsia]MDB8806291.1 LacI family DNA-binding transcriptional regulator [Romboutsia sp. 1001216sp1]MDB8809094.1 LacI family DNA-binding transcriptional regulator [Romboutsia sp. 1001216sp1]MDB8811939.1 LacI family DNA-binding transcriptional regulator [Romboutsia sp. 1001216sp1]MDB8817685.1 LacI family DNA-binding transcriptional regulator [Romboutsia sp. 1001216sp1]MDB8820494.1 LacI family DNA-binding transcrip